MTITKYTPDKRTPIQWASGTSTEIFIFPPDASFASRNFLFRISTATVEADESVFTHFAGITRHLMILQGELELIHEGRYTKHLKPYDQDTFSGEWSTRSKGRVTDFNLMLKEGATGSLTAHPISQGETLNLTASGNYYFIYLAKGEANYEINKTANAGDLLHITAGTQINLFAHETCSFIEIKVSFNRLKIS